MKRSATLFLPLAMLVSAPAAHAVAVVGGDTRVVVAEAFVGLIGGVTGTATVVSASPLTANFPITGGDLDASLAGQILHEGSGLTLSSGGTTVGVGNFIIDTVNSQVLGDVTLNGAAFASDFALFSFDLSTVTVAQLTDLANPALGLFITAGASDAFEAAFGVADVTGARFGSAATAPALVPEPGAWALMIAGFGLVGSALRRRARIAVAAA